MIGLNIKFYRCAALCLLGFLAVALLAGCASKKSANIKDSDEPKLITDIITSEDDESTIVTVRGNKLLTYTAVKQQFPRGVMFDFPDTALDKIKTVYYPPRNNTISLIKAEEKEDGRGARVFIALKRDVPYELTPDETGLHISFPKAGPAAAQTEARKERAEKKIAPPLPPVEKTVPPATRLESVSADALKNHMVINVKANGTIKDFKSFTISDPAPPRIVFDLNKIKSPYKGQQTITVNTKWAKRVRHFGYPDKVRLVVDTNKANLSKFAAAPVGNGLLIQMGDYPKTTGKQLPKPVTTEQEKSALAKKGTPSAAAASKTAEVKSSKPASTGPPAWMNRIDFSSEAAGKSAIIIGTTRPVQYEIKKVSDKTLHLKLYNTNLPDYRKRALITTRFESAVDRITPMQTKEMKNDTLIAIEMREKVPYYVDQDEKIIRVNFSPSSIPPKPYEDAKPPAWKQVLAEAPADVKKEVAKSQEKLAAAPQKELKMAAADKKLGIEAADKEPSLETRLASKAPAEQKYTGEKIALDFYDTDIKNVFRILKEISGKNFAIDKNVTGKVTLSLDKPVPWDQVMDLVLKMNQLGMTMEGDIIRIATLSTLAQEEKLKQAQFKAEQVAIKQEKALEPLFTEYIAINYSNAKKEILPHLQPILTENRGKISVDERNNQIILTDTAEKIKQAKEVVQKIDQVTPQVIIEARIVEANTNFSRDVGFSWGEVILGPFDIGDFTVGPTAFLANNLPFNILPTAEGVFNFAKMTGTSFDIINAVIQASEVEGKSNIVSAPRIVTINNKKAKIKQGFEVPYLERDSSGNATVRFKDVDLLLEVTPQVTPDDRIVMSIFVTKNDLVDPTADEPALSTNEAETEVLVDDGDTIVIGGILKSTLTWGERGIPGMRNVGVLGWLFKSRSTDDRKNELLIFLTPRIVQLEQRRI